MANLSKPCQEYFLKKIVHQYFKKKTREKRNVTKIK